MAYVTPLYGGSDAQVDYRLGLVHGCEADAQFSYHADGSERALRWIGAGLDAFGVEGVYAGAELRQDQFEMARRLVAGAHIGTGEQLVAPKLAVPAAAKVALAPLVAAVEQAATTRGVAAAALFDGATAKAWGIATRGVARRGAAAVARVDEAASLAEAAGLNPDQVWGVETVAAAVANLVEVKPVLDANGEPVRLADGTPKLATVQRRERVGIAGYDIGITLPKSLSVLLAFAPDGLVKGIEDSYVEACNRTFSWTESRTSYVKRGHHGGGLAARRERSSGLSGWVMTHRTARPVGKEPFGDPHWHVHITIGNLAQAPDGSWLTVAAGGRELMRHAAAIDKVTQAQIRASLHHGYGIDFERSARSGLWELAHIPQPTLELFSKRHRQVAEVLAALGYSNATASAKDARVLTRASRSAKSETTTAPDTTLRAAWRAQALAAGQNPEVWLPLVLARYQGGQHSAGERANAGMAARHGISVDGLVAVLTDPEHGLTANRRRFSQLDAVTAVADALPYGASVAEVEGLVEVVLSHPAFVALAGDNTLAAGQESQATQLAGSHLMAGGQLYTTADVPEAERRILAAVAGADPAQRRAVVAPEVLAMAVSVTEATQGFELSGEQRAVLALVTSNGRAVEAVVGPPGTGKTTLMRAARVAWAGQGFVVAGAATAAVAAQNLAAESGIASRTVAQWLARIEQGSGLGGVDVLVLDEANLTCDRDRAALYEAAEVAGTKIVEIGDPKQLRGVGFGSMFGYLHAALGGPTLTENRRQRSEDERGALAAFRDGRYTEALSTWARVGGVHATHSSVEGVAAMVTTYLRQAGGAPDPHTQAQGLVMLAATNEAVSRINQATQAVRAAQGHLGAGASFEVGAGRVVEFRVGDQVLIRRNDRTQKAVSGQAVLNGYRGVVTDVSAAGVGVAWRQPGDTPGDPLRTATCSPGYIAEGGLDLGYCLTGHKAEGLTVAGNWTRADGTTHHGSVLVWSPGMDNPGLYVAASRDKGSTILFGALEELEGEREALLYGTPADQEALTDRVIAALAQRATATADNANDRPVLADLNQLPDLNQAPCIQDRLTQDAADHHAAQDAADHHAAQDAAAAARQPAGHTVHEAAVEAETPVEQHVPARAEQEPAVVMDTPGMGEHSNTGEHTDTGGGQVGEREQWESWLELTGAVHAGERSCDLEKLREAFAARRGYERDVMGELGRQHMAVSGTWEQYCQARELTDEQRQRWRELRDKSTAAWLGGDPEARQAIEAERNAYREELGEARAQRLHHESMREYAQRRAEREQAVADREAAEAAAKQAHRAWLARPHSTLTDDQLDRAITAAHGKHTVNLAAAQRARQQHTETEPTVLAGHGPRVAALDAALTQARRVLAVHNEGSGVHEGLCRAQGAAKACAGEAWRTEQQARTTSRLRPGRRERLLAEAAELRERRQTWLEQAGELQAQLGELEKQGWLPGRDSRWLRAQLERAAASYPAERDQAHQLDVQELNSTHQRIALCQTAANTAAEQGAGYTAERALRADMAPEQHTIEHSLRAAWQAEQQQIAAEQAKHRAEYNRTYQPPTLGHSPKRGRGLGH